MIRVDVTAPVDTTPGSGARVVVLDADADLVVTDRQDAAGALEALELVLAAGCDVVLSTSQSLSGLLQLARGFGIREGYGFCSHGALAVRLDAAMPGGYALLDVITFDLSVLRLALEDLQFPAGTLVAAEDVGTGRRINRHFGTELPSGIQEGAPLSRPSGKTISLARLHAPGIREYADALAACTGLKVIPTGPDSCEVTGQEASRNAADDAVRTRLGLPTHATVVAGDSLGESVTALVPPEALQPGLSPLAAQLTAAVMTASATGSEPGTTLRVWHGEHAYLATAEVWARRKHGWVRHAPVPAGCGATMREVEQAARDAGLNYPRGVESRRRPWWRSTADAACDGRPAGFELSLTRP
ncbi:hypothetical protein GCM10027059_19610 [Myceligenerans halotolerans]